MSDLKFPHLNKDSVLTGTELANKLQSLVGTKFPLTDKPRTNGSNLRKAITKILDDGSIKVADKKCISLLHYIPYNQFRKLLKQQLL